MHNKTAEMGEMAMNYYIVWLKNTTSSKDNEPLKVKAQNKQQAGEIALKKDWPGRWTLGNIYTLSEFKKADPWWADILQKNRAWNE